MERRDIMSVLGAYQWFDKGQLAHRYPICTVEFLKALESFANGVNTASNNEIKKAKRERDK